VREGKNDAVMTYWGSGEGSAVGSVSGVEEDKANKFGEVIFYIFNKFIFGKYLSKSKFVKLYYYRQLK
jgi:hypothetical protein